VRGAGSYGISWSRDGIVFGQVGGIFRVSENGGTPELIAKATGTDRLSSPQLLPGGRAVLMSKSAPGSASWDDAEIVVEDLDPTSVWSWFVVALTRTMCRPDTSCTPGPVIFWPSVRLKTRKVVGTPVPLLSGCGDGDRRRHRVRAGGHLGYGNVGVRVWHLTLEQQLVWVDRQGREQVVATEPAVQLTTSLTRRHANRVQRERGRQYMDIFIREGLAMPHAADVRSRLGHGSAVDA
jgi:hypothetical protein